jgi:LL-H family phage holin
MDITPVVNAVIALIAAVVTAFVIPWVKSKTTAAQREEINAWVKIAVTAAEQIYSGSGKGKEKKKYVLDFLAEKNLKIDEESVDLMIESAVKEMNDTFNAPENIHVVSGFGACTGFDDIESDYEEEGEE